MSVIVYGMPVSMNAVGPALVAKALGVGDMQVCDLMKGDHKKEEFTKINPMQKIPALVDGDVKIGESCAILRYLALKYKGELYPVAKPEVCAKIDFAMDSFNTECGPAQSAVVYVKLGFMQGEITAEKCEAYAAAMKKWASVFLAEGPYVAGDNITIADYKVVPFFFCAMCVAEKIDTFTVPREIVDYVNKFMADVPATAMLTSFGGFSIKEFVATK